MFQVPKLTKLPAMMAWGRGEAMMRAVPLMSLQKMLHYACVQCTSEFRPLDVYVSLRSSSSMVKIKRHVEASDLPDALIEGGDGQFILIKDSKFHQHNLFTPFQNLSELFEIFLGRKRELFSNCNIFLLHFRPAAWVTSPVLRKESLAEARLIS
ncbi:hypothetical protein Fot_10909 [Forsythia ovata]|uniref:Uncharacterized protein n=1 Tax=Forsythia ovata TaxID=205694 RepID=A0ABD1WI70_9LAMI